MIRHGSNMRTMGAVTTQPRNYRAVVSSKTNTRDMEGEGIKDILKNVIETGNSALKSQLASDIKNLSIIPASDANARKSYPGEIHALLKLQNGKTGVANYMGPGTNLVTRLRNNDPPRTLVDKVAQAHDIRYSLAKDLEDISRADNRMIGKVADLRKRKLDHPMNLAQADLIKVKKIGETVGVLKKDAFAGHLGDKIKPSDRKLMQKKLSELEQEGFGLLPGDALKMKLLKKHVRSIPRSKKQKGKGVNLAGTGQKKLIDIVVDGAIPSLMKAMKLPVHYNKSQLKMIIRKGIGNKKFTKANSKSILQSIAKILLGIVTHSAVKSNKLKIKGSGVGLAGSGLLNKMLVGLMRFLKFGSSFKNRLQERKMEDLRKGTIGHGNFWADFAKGFKMVMKPGAMVLGTAADMMGVPEVGIPLQMLSSAM